MKERKEKDIEEYAGFKARVVIINHNTNILSGYYDNKLIVQKPLIRNQEIIVQCLPDCVGTIAN